MGENNMITYKNIWNYAQNKPSLIVKDITEKYPDVDPNFIYEVLLKRGVFKWFAVRRAIIKLKHQWKKDLTWLMIQQQLDRKHWRSKVINQLNKCRQQIRKLCHSQRWQVQDTDEKSKAFLKYYTNSVYGKHIINQ